MPALGRRRYLRLQKGTVCSIPESDIAGVLSDTR